MGQRSKGLASIKMATLMTLTVMTALPACFHPRATGQSTVSAGPLVTPRASIQPPWTRTSAERKLAIDNRMERPLSGRCIYTATVHGTVREIQTTGRTTEYVPSLTIQGNLSCPDIVTRHVAAHTLDGRRFDRKELERAIERRAAVLFPESGRICTVHPEYVFDGGRLIAESLTQVCTSPVGGGPRATPSESTVPDVHYELTVQSPRYPATRAPGP